MPRKEALRPSPSVSATKFAPGQVKQGNNGFPWKVAVNTKGVHRWVPVGKHPKRSTKKKPPRPSPTESATKFAPGKVKRGNNGKRYMVKVDKNNVHRWVLVRRATKKATKKGATAKKKKATAKKRTSTKKSRR